MIKESQIRELVEEELKDSDTFIVELSVSSGNAIKVLIDGDKGASIDQCVKVSRLIEGSLDRDLEDFELQVSSPGADQPLKVKRQYPKHIGRNVKVVTSAGKLEGELINVQENEILVKTREKRRIEGRKAKEWVEEEHSIPFENIIETKVIIAFK
ncbi:MAG: ribosome assembly cofactor RimP [Flavobacteriales bacterium]|nr:ribosome assembly cofactor RimP [Flavobacteriales bacterium]